jgi:hypothetical protein
MSLGIGGQVTWAAALQALASIIGFAVIGYQVIHLRKNIRGATQDRLYAHYTEICKSLMQKPHLYPYFYERKTLSPASSLDTEENLRYEIDLMSETILGLIEHSCLQQKNLPKDSWKNCWLPYALERLDKSPAIEKFFNPNQGWYTSALCSVVNEFYAKKRRPKPTSVVQKS